MFKSIVLGVDSSEHSRHAQTLAFYLARQLHASVLGLHVVDILSFEGPLFNDIAAPADLESYLDAPQVRETLTARGSTEEAGRIIDAVLARSAKDDEALAAKGRLLLAQGRPAEAVPYLEQGGDGQEVEPLVELGELFLRLGQPARARESAERALARVPGHPWALAVAGRALIEEQRRAEGLAALQKALANRPRQPEGWLSLARAFEAAGQSREADLCRRKAEEARRS